MKIRAIEIEVYRRNGVDCTNGGISSLFDRLIIPAPHGHLDIDTDEPPENLAMVEKRFLYGQDVYSICPAKVAPDGTVTKRDGWWMFGGNYAASCDARFHSQIGDMYGAVAIHDRREV